MTANMTFGTNILPKTDNTQELGSSTQQWKINASTINGVSVGSNQLATVAQNITGAINELKNNISSLESTVGSFDSPASVFFDFQFSIAVADWTALSGGTYQALINNNKITANSGIWVFFNDTYQSYAAAPINTTTDNTNHNAVFTTTIVPTGTITGWIRVVDSVNDILPVTRGGTGCGTLVEAQSALGITALNNNLNSKINTSAIANNLTTTTTGYVLDARQGKTLNDKIVEKSSISYKSWISIIRNTQTAYVQIGGTYRTGTVIASGYRPSFNVYIACVGSQSGVYFPALVTILPNGTITCSTNYNWGQASATDNAIEIYGNGAYTIA